jgi:ribosome biogenesis GTPase A
MTSSFWNVVNKIIRESDVIMQVLDARFPEETRNTEIEDKVKAKSKPIIYVQNKCDMVGKKEKKTLKVGYQVMVSSKENLGTTKLRSLLRMLKGSKTGITIGVLGYPNTGKSSLINALKQRKSASTSPKAGHTLGVQKLRIGPGMYLLDSPGVYPYKEDNEEKLAMINCLNPDDLEEPDLVAVQLILQYGKRVCKFYGVELDKDPEEVLERITMRLNLYKKGKELNIDRASRQIVSDWQRGKIKK